MRCSHCDAAVHKHARRCPECNAPLTRPREIGGLVGFGAALAIALGIGSVTYLVVFLLADEADAMGWSLFLAVPTAIGANFGLLAAARTWQVLIGVPLLLCGLLLVLEFAGAHGVSCVAILGIIFLVPMYVGAMIGWVARRLILKTRRQRVTAVVLLALAPIGMQLAVSPHEPERITVQSSATIDAPAAEVWRALHFYEEIEEEPPLLLRLFPVPVRAEGSRAAVGDIETCVYDSGRIVKRITERVAERRLAFEVIEQRLHLERDLTILGGSFELVPLGPNRTRLILTTRYTPHAYPGWLWRSAESWVLHTLHAHVATAIRRRAKQSLKNVG